MPDGGAYLQYGKRWNINKHLKEAKEESTNDFFFFLAPESMQRTHTRVYCVHVCGCAFEVFVSLGVLPSLKYWSLLSYLQAFTFDA